MNHPIDVLLSRLEGVKETGTGRYMARCPSHDDKSPSLSVADDNGKVLVHCFAGCEPLEIMAAVDLTLADLFDKPLNHRGKPIPKRDRWDARASLKELSDESVVVLIAATDLLQQKPLTQDDYKRLRVAADRIARIMEVTA
jgi:hypothetical protein